MMILQTTIQDFKEHLGCAQLGENQRFVMTLEKIDLTMQTEEGEWKPWYVLFEEATHRISDVSSPAKRLYLANNLFGQSALTLF